MHRQGPRQGARRPPGPRFSVLLLEDGDQYVRDWVATCHVSPPREGLLGLLGLQGQEGLRQEAQGQKGQGRGGGGLQGQLRLSLRSLFFDPWDAHAALFWFPLRPEATRVVRLPGRLQLRCTKYVRLKAGQQESPYETVKAGQQEGPYEAVRAGGGDQRPREDLVWEFSLDYSPTEEVRGTGRSDEGALATRYVPTEEMGGVPIARPEGPIAGLGLAWPRTAGHA